MSFKTNEYQQITLNDSFINLSPRTQKIIMNSWCKDFADIVFPAINEERFAVLYSNNNASRPNTPINFIIGSLMLKENNGLTDDELVESICMLCIRHILLNSQSVTGHSAVSEKGFITTKWRLAQTFLRKKCCISQISMQDT